MKQSMPRPTKGDPRRALIGGFADFILSTTLSKVVMVQEVVNVFCKVKLRVL